MCDERVFAEQDAYAGPPGPMTRREFGVLSAGVGLAALWPEAAEAASAADVTGGEVVVPTPDGKADCYFTRPSSGKHPGVILWPDAFGLRAAMRRMGDRLASSGYAVLVVNPYYRKAKGQILPDGADFADPATRDTIMSMMGSLSPTTHVADAKAFVDWLDAQPSVARDRKMGTLGYCMGGSITFRTAAARADRVGAAASFHGGGLVTDKPESPHLLIPTMKASLLIAIGQNDDEAEPHAKDVLRETCAKAKVPAEIEVYPAQHGWCPPDMKVYDEVQAERAWARLLALFGGALAAKA